MSDNKQSPNIVRGALELTVDSTESKSFNSTDKITHQSGKLAPDFVYNSDLHLPSHDHHSSAHTWRLEDDVSESDRILCFQWKNRVKPHIWREMSSIVPGIHPDYVRRFENEPGVYKPNDIWKLRHLKPLLRQRVHRKFRELAQNMILTDYETESHWKLWNLIKSKSCALHQREKDFHRQYEEMEYRITDKSGTQVLLPWTKLVKYQSFPVFFDYRSHPQRLRPVWPKEVQNLVLDSNTRGTKRRSGDVERSDTVASKRYRLEQGEAEAQVGNNDIEFMQMVHDFNAPNQYDETVDDLSEDVKLQQTAEDAQETARKAKIDTDVKIDKALYLEYKGQIEFIWRTFPGKSKNAPQWEKTGAWKSWLRNAGKSIPTPSEARLQEAKMNFEPIRKSTTSSVVSVTESVSTESTRFVMLDPEAGDYEDPKDDSTWYEFPGSEYRYLCGHWKDMCRERRCSPRDSNHVCCHVGLTREKKLVSLKRLEYRRKEMRN